MVKGLVMGEEKTDHLDVFSHGGKMERIPLIDMLGQDIRQTAVVDIDCQARGETDSS